MVTILLTIPIHPHCYDNSTFNCKTMKTTFVHMCTQYVKYNNIHITHLPKHKCYYLDILVLMELFCHRWWPVKLCWLKMFLWKLTGSKNFIFTRWHRSLKSISNDDNKYVQSLEVITCDKNNLLSESLLWEQ